MKSNNDKENNTLEKPKSFLERTYNYLLPKINSKYVANKDKSNAHITDDFVSDKVQEFVEKIPLSFLGKSLSGYLFPQEPKTFRGKVLKFCAKAVDSTKWLVYQSVKQPTMIAYQGLGTLYNAGAYIKNKVTGDSAKAEESAKNFRYRATECAKAIGSTAILAGIATVTAMTAGFAIPFLTPIVSAIPGVTSAVGAVQFASTQAAGAITPIAGDMAGKMTSMATSASIKSASQYAIKHPVKVAAAVIIGTEVAKNRKNKMRNILDKNLINRAHNYLESSKIFRAATEKRLKELEQNLRQ